METKMNISTLALSLYRKLNPRSRAVAHTNWCRSTGGVRRATCTYCRRVVATSSAEYPETLRSIRARYEHGEACAEAYAAAQLGETIRVGLESLNA